MTGGNMSEFPRQRDLGEGRREGRKEGRREGPPTVGSIALHCAQGGPWRWRSSFCGPFPWFWREAKHPRPASSCGVVGVARPCSDLRRRGLDGWPGGRGGRRVGKREGLACGDGRVGCRHERGDCGSGEARQETGTRVGRGRGPGWRQERREGRRLVEECLRPGPRRDKGGVLALGVKAVDELGAPRASSSLSRA
jgi:hypothetical protein